MFRIPPTHALPSSAGAGRDDVGLPLDTVAEAAPVSALCIHDGPSMVARMAYWRSPLGYHRFVQKKNKKLSKIRHIGVCTSGIWGRLTTLLFHKCINVIDARQFETHTILDTVTQ